MVDIILRLMLWDWRETHVDEEITCLSYAPSRDVIAAGSEACTLCFINAQTGEPADFSVWLASLAPHATAVSRYNSLSLERDGGGVRARVRTKWYIDLVRSQQVSADIWRSQHRGAFTGVMCVCY